MDGDQVGAAQGVEVDLLHPCGVHGDVGHVTEETQPVPVGGQVDMLGNIGTVKEHGVAAVLALDRVTAVAGVPDEGVVAGTHQRQIVALAAGDRVVPVAAHKPLRSGAS